MLFLGSDSEPSRPHPTVSIFPVLCAPRRLPFGTLDGLVTLRVSGQRAVTSSWFPVSLYFYVGTARTAELCQVSRALPAPPWATWSLLRLGGAPTPRAAPGLLQAILRLLGVGFCSWTEGTHGGSWSGTGQGGVSVLDTGL